MDSRGYENVWKKETNLEAINKNIHGGWPTDKLAERAQGYCNLLFKTLFPFAAPKNNSVVAEFGSGVGWIMQSMLENFPIQKIVGLDISDNMISKAKERWQDMRAEFILYDGLKLPIPDNTFDTVYSVEAIQHIEKHIAFILFKELYRILVPNGHAVLQFLSIHHMKEFGIPYEQECWNHINNNVTAHWHHFYSYDELKVLFSELIGVDNFDIRYANMSYFVHFSKGTGKKFMKQDLSQLLDLEMKLLK